MGIRGWLSQRLGYIYGPRLMSRLRRRWMLVRHAHADVRIDPSAILGPGFALRIPADGHFHVGPRVEFRRGFLAEISEGGRITIGADSVFTYNALIQCSTEMTIGERCMFGQSSMLVDGNHKFRDLSKPMLEQGYDRGPITIGDDAVVTTKVTVIANLGERAFVGAGSVVTKDVPAYSVAVGAPAKVVDYFGPDS